MMSKEAKAFHWGAASMILGIALSIILLKFALLAPVTITIQPWSK